MKNAQISIEEARRRAAAVGYTMADGEARETDRWWFFPVLQIGSKGLVVDKQEGAVTALGSGGELDDWLWAYDAGVVRGDANVVDLIVEEFHDLQHAIAALQSIGIHTNNWRKIRDALASLPARFERVPLWMRMRELREIDPSTLRWRVERS